MKKEEVLELSRKENKKKNIYEIEVETKGCKIAAVIMLLLASIYYCYEIISGKGTNNALYSIITVYCATLYIYKGIKLEDKKGLHLLCGSIWALLTIMLVLNYFKII